MGATQSIGRSTYSKLLPETHDHATYFSFYDVTEKIAIVLGMFIFGLLISMTGSMQYSVLFLAVFFAFSYIVDGFDVSMQNSKRMQVMQPQGHFDEEFPNGRLL